MRRPVARDGKRKTPRSQERSTASGLSHAGNRAVNRASLKLRAWMCLMGFQLSMTINGILYGNDVFVPFIVEALVSDDTPVTLMGSLQVCFSAIAAIPAHLMIKRIGCRKTCGIKAVHTGLDPGRLQAASSAA